MNRVLSLLLAYVFLQTQTWALSGGPFQNTGDVNISLLGTYAGVLIPEEGARAGKSLSGEKLNPSVTSIGLFSLGVPETGLARGGAILFVNGDPFSGTITGVADPGKGTLSGIVDLISNFVLFNPAFPDVPFRIFATGKIEADIFALSQPQSFGTTGPLPGSTRIEGTAVLNLSGGGEEYDRVVSYSVDGYKQSETVNVATEGFGDIGGGGDDDGGGDGGGEG